MLHEEAVLKKRKAKSKKPSRAKRRQRAKDGTQTRAQKWLVLAGTKEARDFIERWRERSEVVLMASLAGVTTQAADLGVATRVGGFSYEKDGIMIDGKTAMAAFLSDERFDAVIDLTHPFAQRISANARAASATAKIAYFQFLRAPWQPLAEDDWHYHESWEALFSAVKTRHLFLAGGHEALASVIKGDSTPSKSMHITARMIEPPATALSDLPETVSIMLGAPGRAVQDEYALFRKLKITAVAAKLSGGKASSAKLAAARELGLPVHLVKRPDYPEGFFTTLRALHHALGRHLSDVGSHRPD